MTSLRRPILFPTTDEERAEDEAELARLEREYDNLPLDHEDATPELQKRIAELRARLEPSL